MQALLIAVAGVILVLVGAGMLEASPTPSHTYEIVYPDSSTKCIIAKARSNNKVSISCDFNYTGEQQ